MLTQSDPSNPTSATGTAQRGPGVRARLARRASDSGGFTLVEVLVVVLIVGILSAIAITSLLSTTTKAQDVQAKSLVSSAQTAAEAIGAEQGNYLSVTPAAIAAEEPTIPITASKQHAYLSNATQGENEYTITATATNGDELTIARSATGAISRTCHSPTLKTGCGGGENSTW